MGLLALAWSIPDGFERGIASHPAPSDAGDSSPHAPAENQGLPTEPKPLTLELADTYDHPGAPSPTMAPPLPFGAAPPAPEEPSAEAPAASTPPPVEAAPEPANQGMEPYDGPLAANAAEAVGLSRQLEKPILLVFVSERCGWCRKLRAETLTNPTVRDAQRKYVSVFLDDADPATARLKTLYQVKGLPTYVIIDQQGRALKTGAGYRERASEFADWLDDQDVWVAWNAARNPAKKRVAGPSGSARIDN